MDLEYITIGAALTAGRHVRNHAFDISELEFKSIDDPVTDLDRSAERLVMQYFNNNGNFNYIGEEFGETDNGSQLTVMTDPIDGTKSFVYGDFNSSTSICVVGENGPLVSVVYDFMRDILYVANENRAYLIQDTFLRLDSKIPLPRRFPAFSKKRVLSTEPDQVPDAILDEPYRVYQQIGSVALSMAQVASGSYDAFYAPPYKKEGAHDIGDMLAGVYLLEKAGFKVMDSQFNELDKNSLYHGVYAVR